MAVSATFKADFSNFLDAVQRADVKLKGFNDSLGRVDRDLARFGNQFSGVTITREATLAANAIERLGEEGGIAAGLTKLTANELQRVGTLAKEAAAKLTAMGQEVPPKIQAIVNATNPLPEKLTLSARAADLAKSSFGQMFGAFSAANLVQNAVTGLVNMGKAAFEDAGKIADLSAKLGISTEAIQRMEFVAGQTGGTVEQFASAAFKLQTRLAGGSDSVASAARDLGVSLAELQRMKPEAQFETVAGALGKMDDATKRNQIGVALFGKSFEQIAAGVAANYEQLARSADVTSDAQIQALDRAGDAWDRYADRQKKTLRAVLGDVVAFGEAVSRSSFFEKLEALASINTPGGIAASGLFGKSRLAAPRENDIQLRENKKQTEDFVEALKKAEAQVKSLSKEQREQIDAALKLGVSVDDLSDKYGLSEETLRLYTGQVKAVTKAHNEDTEAKKKQAAAYRQFDSEMRNAQGMAFFEQDAAFLNSPTSSATKRLQELTAKAVSPNLVLPQGVTSSGRDLQNMLLKAVIPGEEFAKKANQQITQTMRGIFSGFGRSIQTDLGPTILSAITGGGNVAGSIGGLFGGKLAGILGDGLKKSIGGAIGGVIGSIVPGIGTLVGSLAGPLFGKIGGFFKGLFGGGEGAKVNDLRDAAFDAAGGFDALNRKAGELGISLDSVLKPSKVKDFERAWADLQKTLGEAEADQLRLNEAIVKYGFTIEELGPKFQAQRLNEQAKELIEDWRVLVAAGLDVSTVGGRMAESINDYLKTAIKVGSEVPAAFKPILELMARQGKLVDENGEEIKDLEKAGVTFSETMTEGFDRVVKKLDELIKKLQGAGAEIGNIPAINIPVNVEDFESQLRGKLGDQSPWQFIRGGAVPMAGGGSGMVTKPTLFLAGEAGPEQYAFSGANKSLDSGTGAVVVELAAVRAELAAIRREQGLTVGRAVKDALALQRLRVS